MSSLPDKHCMWPWCKDASPITVLQTLMLKRFLPRLSVIVLFGRACALTCWSFELLFQMDYREIVLFNWLEVWAASFFRSTSTNWQTVHWKQHAALHPEAGWWPSPPHVSSLLRALPSWSSAARSTAVARAACAYGQPRSEPAPPGSGALPYTSTPISHRDIPAKDPQIPLPDCSPSSPLSVSEHCMTNTLIVSKKWEILMGCYLFQTKAKHYSPCFAVCSVPVGKEPSAVYGTTIPTRPSYGRSQCRYSGSALTSERPFERGIFVVLPGKFHKKDVTNEKRSQGWHFSILFISRQLQLDSPHVLGVSAHLTTSIPLLIWARSLAASSSDYRDSPASAADHQVNASSPSFVIAQMNQWPRKLVWGFCCLLLCHETSLFSPVHREKGVLLTVHWTFLFSGVFLSKRHHPQVRKSGAGGWQVGFSLGTASTTCYSVVGISTKYTSPRLEEKSGFVSLWIAVCNEMILAGEAVIKMY